ncbi:MAG: cytochrome b N-terminal domain-containing protein [Deltaproteobacteria bacterium]|nr:cytochrome b N-terminal domain-containing protein [Deltaproteobacteria bacterium]
MAKVRAWLDDRTGYRKLVAGALDEPVPGGASFAYVFGSVLTFVFVLQAITGVMLAFYYSPSSTDAWASVAYIQDQVSLGWFIRGLHSYGASAMVILACLHMLQTAVYGAYKKPRELNWIIGVVMLGVILAFALTGYLLPWDQKGYWATKVATGIAGTSPLIGEQLQQGVQGGNEYGNLTLTRFYAIHVFLLPGVLIALLIAHIGLFRRHGVTPHWRHSAEQLTERTQPFWPDQLFKDMVAIALAFAVLVGLNFYSHGAELGAPADPSSNFDARPEWYLRAVFQALKYFEGPMEAVVALGVPPIVGGILIALPFLDRGESRNPRKRMAYLGLFSLLFVVAGILTVLSFAEDAADPELQERLEAAEARAAEARELAVEHGVPAAGGTAVFTTAPHYRALQIWTKDCASCHQGSDRTGPEIGPGYNSRPWLHNYLLDPRGDLFFGTTSDQMMKPVKFRGADLDAVVEAIYAQTGAGDVDAKLAARGLDIFEEESCSGCHTIDEVSEDTGPNLFERGTVDYLTDLIGHAQAERFYGEDSEMPPFFDPYNREQRRAVAEWLVTLRDQPYPHPRARPGPPPAEQTKKDDEIEGSEPDSPKPRVP